MTTQHALIVTAMYMAVGAERALLDMDRDSYEMMSDRRGGHIGIMGDLASLAVESESHLAALNVVDYPGVYDYEVSEPFGVWFVENDPERQVAVAKLHELIAAFFAQDRGVLA